MLLVSRSGLVEEDAVEVLTCLLFWCEILSPFQENNNVVVFQFPSHILMPLTNCGSSTFKDSFTSSVQLVQKKKWRDLRMKLSCGVIFSVCSHTFILLWLRKASMSVETYPLSFRMFICASHPEISSFSSVIVSMFYSYYCNLKMCFKWPSLYSQYEINLEWSEDLLKQLLLYEWDLLEKVSETNSYAGVNIKGKPGKVEW